VLSYLFFYFISSGFYDLFCDMYFCIIDGGVVSIVNRLWAELRFNS
jgi:hypothetical protein